MMTIRKANTILYCRRWKAQVTFYEDVLRLPVLTRKDWFVEFRLGPDSALSVADEGRTTVRSAGGAGITISIRVDEVERVQQEVIDRGAQPEPLRTVWGSRAFFLRDPEGNRLEFWS